MGVSKTCGSLLGGLRNLAASIFGLILRFVYPWKLPPYCGKLFPVYDEMLIPHFAFFNILIYRCVLSYSITIVYVYIYICFSVLL